jgi:hypothetical protein
MLTKIENPTKEEMFEAYQNVAKLLRKFLAEIEAGDWAYAAHQMTMYGIQGLGCEQCGEYLIEASTALTGGDADKAKTILTQMVESLDEWLASPDCCLK